MNTLKIAGTTIVEVLKALIGLKDDVRGIVVEVKFVSTLGAIRRLTAWAATCRPFGWEVLTPGVRPCRTPDEVVEMAGKVDTLTLRFHDKWTAICVVAAAWFECLKLGSKFFSPTESKFTWWFLRQTDVTRSEANFWPQGSDKTHDALRKAVENLKPRYDSGARGPAPEGWKFTNCDWTKSLVELGWVKAAKPTAPATTPVAEPTESAS